MQIKTGSVCTRQSDQNEFIFLRNLYFFIPLHSITNRPNDLKTYCGVGICIKIEGS